MIKKDRTIICIATVMLIILMGAIYIAKQNTLIFAGEDVLFVEAKHPIKAKKIKIEYGFNSLNRKSDLELFDDRERYSLIYDGEIKDSLKTGYGENDFLITYDDTFYLSFRQFKTRRGYFHKYSFLLYQVDSTPMLNVKIEGENDMSFDVPMIPVNLAGQYVVNTPIDSAGIIYDFFKLTKPSSSREQEEENKKEEEEIINKIKKLF